MRPFFILVLPLLASLLSASCRDNTANNSVSPQINRNQVVAPNTNANVNANANAAQTNVEIPVYDYEIVKAYKHDDDAFTQGLVFHNGWLYESDGQYGDSSLRKVELATGKVKQEHKLDDKYFAEGMTILNGKIYQITWEEKTCFVYDLATLEPTTIFAYSGEGWGLTNDGTNLIMSDGSNTLSFRDPNNFRTVRTVNVTHNGKPLYLLNELEYVDGEVWANIWHSEETETNGRPNVGKPNYIARINPTDGKVTGWIDLNGISPDDTNRDRENTLNGIAYDAAANRIFVTGKRWRQLFEIKIKNK